MRGHEVICPLCTGHRIIYLGRESNPRTRQWVFFSLCQHYWRIVFFFFFFSFHCRHKWRILLVFFLLSPLLAYFFGIFFFHCHHYWRIFFGIFFFHMIHNNTIYMHIIIFTKPPRIKHAYNQALQISLHGNIIQVTETSALMLAREIHVL